MMQQEAICPDGLKACKVPGGSADAFEVSEARGSWLLARGRSTRGGRSDRADSALKCIDTQFNDESCGGCVAGDYPSVPFSHFGIK
jgi:hypothetical protein